MQGEPVETSLDVKDQTQSVGQSPVEYVVSLWPLHDIVSACKDREVNIHRDSKMTKQGASRARCGGVIA